jgi:phospholipid/cholesterol/gamma-HCH transport system substrate-binding protein
METRAHHILIGAFVLLALIGGVLFALWVAKVELDAEFDEYDVVFHETVTGLSRGAAVNFNGIQVGEVRKLSLDLADAQRVIARVRVNADTPVRTDTRARLTYTGLTGVAIIELVAGDPQAPEPVIPEGREVPLIRAEPSALQQLMSGSTDIMARFNEALVRVSTFLNEENLGRLSTTIAHVEEVTGQMAADRAELGAALRSAKTAFADLSRAAAAVEKLAGSGETMLASSQRLIDEDLSQASHDLREALAALRRLSENADALLAENRTQLDQLAREGGPEMTATLRELGELSRRLNRISEKLEAAPADYLLQRDRLREYPAQ